MTKKPFYNLLHKRFQDKYGEFGFEYDRAEDLYEAMKTIHRLVNSRDNSNLLKLSEDHFLGSALIDVAEAFGKLDGRGTSFKFRFEYSGHQNDEKIKLFPKGRNY
tara:strand:+ start:325 stop:639 length:315 start_codon:yes stop_codon:yes gene_type:complete